MLSRRSLYLLGGAAILVARPSRAAPFVSPVTATLSRYMADAAAMKLPDDVVEQAKLHILDTVGAMVSGSALTPGKAAMDFARAYGGSSVATIVASRLTCGPIEAALVNAILAQADETDDSSAPADSHPGASILPATLAAGERFGIDGLRFIRAVTLGYDVGNRMTITLGTHALEQVGHKSTHAVTATFGSAAAAACTSGLDAQQMRWVLDFAAQQASGTTTWHLDNDHIEKAFVFAGMGARNGVTAALLVQAGWTGVADALVGDDSYFTAYGGPGADPAGLLDQLGQRFEVTQTNIKKWTVGSAIQAPLDALLLLMNQHHFHAHDVREVVVRVAAKEAAVVSNRAMPDITLQHMIAIMLVDGTASFAAAHDVARMNDPAVLRQRAKVNLIPDEDLQRLLPRREATVEVTLNDGTRLTQHVEAVRGTVQNPMPRAEVVAKTTDLMAPILGRERCAALTNQLLTLESLDTVGKLRPLLQA